MKKKYFIMILVLILSLILMGCKGEDVSEKKEDSNSQSETEHVTVQEKGLDSSLNGSALLKSISSDQPETMRIKMNTNMPSIEMVTTTTTYYDRGNTRTETFSEVLGTGVVIYKASEQVMYKYEEGSGQGFRVKDVDIKAAADTGLMMDLSTESLQLTQEIPDDVIARVDNLNGEEVVYIEYTRSDGETGDTSFKMWYSAKYGVFLRYQMIINGELFMSMDTVEIEKDINIDQQMFVAPADINFQDVSIAEINQ